MQTFYFTNSNVMISDYEGSYFDEIYVAPWIRMQPYVIAIAIGYVMNYTKDKKIVLDKVRKDPYLNY